MYIVRVFCFSFEYLERESKAGRCIDVWPLCVWQNDTFDTTFLLLLQLACVLHMKQGKSNVKLRIFIVVESECLLLIYMYMRTVHVYYACVYIYILHTIYKCTCTCIHVYLYYDV